MAVVTFARKLKHSVKKKSDSNKFQMQPSHVASNPRKQAIATGKMVFIERKIAKYRMQVESPEYEVIQLYQSDKF